MTTSHYDVQKKRRDDFAENWRKHRQTVVSAMDGRKVESSSAVAGHRISAFMGEAAGRPTRFLDASTHDFDSGVVTKPVAHSWDSVSFVISGGGRLCLPGRVQPFRKWDAFHTPSFSPYHLEFDEPTQLATFTSFPSVDLLGIARAWDAAGPGDPMDRAAVPLLPEALADRLASHVDEPRTFTDYDEFELRANKKGTRSKFLVDPSIGYRTSGLTMVMTQYAPGGGQAMHCHPGEAFLYVVEGEGESYIGDEPEGGTWYPWKAGDFVVVDHFVWHQHWNRSKEKPARLLRVHMMETMLTSMQAVLDPIQLLIEPEEMMRAMPDPATIQWPADSRPAG